MSAFTNIRVEHGGHTYRVAFCVPLTEPAYVSREAPKRRTLVGPIINPTGRLGRVLVKKAASALLREQLAASVAAGEKA